MKFASLAVVFGLSVPKPHYTSLQLQWSFGVTCWEIFTAGKIPYGGVDPLMLAELLEAGERLYKPSNAACSDEM